MTETPEHYGSHTEMDLGQMLRVLFQRKWLLAGVTLLAGIAAAAYSLTKANVFESEAALIVREPQTALEQEDPEKPALVQEVPTLTVETLQMLAESTETVRTLFGALWDKQLIPEWTGGSGANRESMFRAFQGSLRTELRKQQDRRSAGAIELLPILTLGARAQRPESAQIIANEWASIVETKSREVYTSGLEASDEFIGGMYVKSNDALLKVEQDLSKTTLEASLDLKKARQETFREKIVELEDQILGIEVELAVNEVAIAEGRRRNAEQEFENEWIGTVAEDALLRNQPYPFEPEELSELAEKVRELVEQKVLQREALRAFRREQKLLSKEKRFAHLQLDIERILLEKAKVEDELPALEGSLASLTKKLEGIPEKIVLGKAITDDALWNSTLEGSANPETLATPLQSEAINPLYYSTMESIIELESKIETLRGSSAQYAASAEEVNEMMNDLELEIDGITQELDRRTQALEATEGSLKLIRDDYLTEKNRVDELLVANMRKKEEMEIRLEMREGFETQLSKLEEDVASFKLQIDKLTREVEKTTNVRTALASRAEAVALLSVTAENASRTGTAILYSAEVNPAKVAPARGRLVVMAMIAAGVVTAILVCMAELVRES